LVAIVQTKSHASKSQYINEGPHVDRNLVQDGQEQWSANKLHALYKNKRREKGHGGRFFQSRNPKIKTTQNNRSNPVKDRFQ
jgi:hypothetical protein